MDVNWDAGKFLLELVQFIITVAVAIWAAVRFGQERNKSSIEKMDERQDQLELRILATEKHLEHAPTHEDITEVREEISGIKAELKQNTIMLQRVHDYLMNKKD